MSKLIYQGLNLEFKDIVHKDVYQKFEGTSFDFNFDISVYEEKDKYKIVFHPTKNNIKVNTSGPLLANGNHDSEEKYRFISILSSSNGMIGANITVTVGNITSEKVNLLGSNISWHERIPYGEEFNSYVFDKADTIIYMSKVGTLDNTLTVKVETYKHEKGKMETWTEPNHSSIMKSYKLDDMNSSKILSESIYKNINNKYNSTNVQEFNEKGYMLEDIGIKLDFNYNTSCYKIGENTYRVCFEFIGVAYSQSLHNSFTHGENYKLEMSFITCDGKQELKFLDEESKNHNDKNLNGAGILLSSKGSHYERIINTDDPRFAVRLSGNYTKNKLKTGCLPILEEIPINCSSTLNKDVYVVDERVNISEYMISANGSIFGNIANDIVEVSLERLTFFLQRRSGKDADRTLYFKIKLVPNKLYPNLEIPIFLSYELNEFYDFDVDTNFSCTNTIANDKHGFKVDNFISTIHSLTKDCTHSIKFNKFIKMNEPKIEIEFLDTSKAYYVGVTPKTLSSVKLIKNPNFSNFNYPKLIGEIKDHHIYKTYEKPKHCQLSCDFDAKVFKITDDGYHIAMLNIDTNNLNYIKSLDPATSLRYSTIQLVIRITSEDGDISEAFVLGSDSTGRDGSCAYYPIKKEYEYASYKQPLFFKTVKFKTNSTKFFISFETCWLEFDRDNFNEIERIPFEEKKGNFSLPLSYKSDTVIVSNIELTGDTGFVGEKIEDFTLNFKLIGSDNENIEFTSYLNDTLKSKTFKKINDTDNNVSIKISKSELYNLGRNTKDNKFKLVAKNQYGAKTERQVTFDIGNLNSPPIIDYRGLEKLGVMTKPFRVDFKVSDIDNDKLETFIDINGGRKYCFGDSLDNNFEITEIILKELGANTTGHKVEISVKDPNHAKVIKNIYFDIGDL